MANLIEAVDVAADEQVDAFAEKAYVAELLPDASRRHVEMIGDVMKIPAGAHRCRVTLHRGSLPDTDEVVGKVKAEFTEDGETWRTLVACTARGGIVIHPYTGEVCTETWIETDIAKGAIAVRPVFIPFLDMTTKMSIEFKTDGKI